ncbi:hypothetical protein AAC387_Pa06g2301 [Persea americana]
MGFRSPTSVSMAAVRSSPAPVRDPLFFLPPIRHQPRLHLRQRLHLRPPIHLRLLSTIRLRKHLHHRLPIHLRLHLLVRRRRLRTARRAPTCPRQRHRGLCMCCYLEQVA